MSTHLKSIKGRREAAYHSWTKTISYKPTTMSITAFYGGKKIGPMIQLTLDSNCIQLTKNQVNQLIETLNTRFNG